jgi:hypothetical protein
VCVVWALEGEVGERAGEGSKLQKMGVGRGRK